MKSILFLVLAGVAMAQDKAQDKAQEKPMSEAATAKIAVAQLKYTQAQAALQRFMNDMMDQIRKLEQYKRLDKLNAESLAALEKVVAEEREAAGAEGMDPDVGERVWRKSQASAPKP